jgi:hypothetical protein
MLIDDMGRVTNECDFLSASNALVNRHVAKMQRITLIALHRYSHQHRSGPDLDTDPPQSEGGVLNQICVSHGHQTGFPIPTASMGVVSRTCFPHGRETGFPPPTLSVGFEAALPRQQISKHGGPLATASLIPLPGLASTYEQGWAKDW